jgi:hypothetical protein
MDGVDSDMVQDILSKKYLKDNPPKTERKGLKSVSTDSYNDSKLHRYD